MKIITKISVLFSVLIISLNYQSRAVSGGITDEQIKVLFIGSSYFNSYNMPVIFENLAGYSDKPVYIDRQTINGLYLDDHANSIATEAKISEEDWDYVILQGVGSLVAYPDYFTHHPVYPALEALIKKISGNCESTTIIFCMPFAFEDGMLWYGWDDTFTDMQIKIYNNTIQYSDDLGFSIAPVGWAWLEVLEEVNFPLHYLHMSDWNHPSLRGSYITACVIYSTVFQESSAGIQYYGDLSGEDAEYYQTVASNIVLDSLDLWNIIVKNPLLSEFSIPNEFFLYQNHPNPFKSSTQIKYKILKHSWVEIDIYNKLGEIEKMIVNEYKMPGNYSVSFDGSGLDSGMYFCTMNFGNQYQIKKILLIK